MTSSQKTTKSAKSRASIDKKKQDFDCVHFAFPSGQNIELEIKKTNSTAPSIFFVGIKKGGSTLLAKIVREVAKKGKRELFEFSKMVFDRGIAESFVQEDRDAVFQRPGYIFGIFRWVPESNVLALENIPRSDGSIPRVFLMVRDPRDALVSLYYSDAYSHPVPKDGELRERYLERRDRLKDVPIDSFVMEEATSYARNYFRTLQLLAIPGVTVVRYEDVIYDKVALILIVARELGVHLAASELETLRAKHDVFPEEEKSDAHIRQVHPGNHVSKLSPQTIGYLNRLFFPVLSTFGYSEAETHHAWARFRGP